jgi:hypothetical protein
MENKDIVIGILLIATVGLSGGLGFMLITSQPYQPPAEDPTDLFGLPDDWSNAPNSSYFMLYNQTGASIKVTLKDILDGVALAFEEQAALGPQINEYKNIIYPYTFLDPSSGLSVTGVDLLDILEKYDTNFGWDLTISSSSGYTLDIATGDIIKNMYKGGKNSHIVAIAANKEWLAESPLGPSWGNFTFLIDKYPSAIYDMNSVEVWSNWTVEVVVNGTVEYVIDQNNMTLNEYNDTYHYDRDDWWSFNRHYWGRNISEIISLTPAGVLNYTVRFWSVDEWATPWPYGGKKEPRYNNTHVETGIVPPYPQWADGYLNETADLVNTTEVLPETDLLMALVYADQEFGETWQGVTDPVWPYRRMCGYHRGPFYVIIPGRPRENYLKYITRIEITSYNGSIPVGFKL